MEEKVKKKKSLDEKIENLKDKLKNMEAEKKRLLQRKGLVIWNKIKPLFFIDESVIEDLSQDKEKLEKFKNDISKVLEKHYPKIYKEHKVEKEKEEEKENGV